MSENTSAVVLIPEGKTAHFEINTGVLQGNRLAPYIFIHIHTYSYIFIHIHTYSYIFIHIHTYSYIFIHIHTYSYIFIHIHTYSYIFIHIHTYSYIFIHIHTYSYIFIHIHTYSYIFIKALDYALRTAIDDREGLTVTRRRSTRHPACRLSDLNYADDIALFADTIQEAELLLHEVESASKFSRLFINPSKRKYMHINPFANDDAHSSDGSQIEKVGILIMELGSSSYP